MYSEASIHDVIDVYLAVFFSGVAAFYALRILYKRRFVAPEVVFPGARFSGTWWNHAAFRLFRVLIWGVCVARVFEPRVDAFLGMSSLAESTYVRSAGAVLLTAGFLLALIVHFSLGTDWRSGIDASAPVRLKTTGLYRFSRHPAFVGVAAAQFGFFLALPSVFSAICFAIGIIALDRQALAEERHLDNSFTCEYSEYKKRTRRWM